MKLEIQIISVILFVILSLSRLTDGNNELAKKIDTIKEILNQFKEYSDETSEIGQIDSEEENLLQNLEWIKKYMLTNLSVDQSLEDIQNKKLLINKRISNSRENGIIKSMIRRKSRKHKPFKWG